MSSEVVQFIAVPGKGQPSAPTAAKPAPKTKPQAKKATSNAGRKTDKERLERELELEELRRRVEQEKGRAARLQPDTKPVLGVALVMSALILATSFAISYATMAATAEWMKLPFPWLAYALPGAIELFMVFATIDYLITRSRGGSGLQAIIVQWVLTGIAVLANSLHTVSVWGEDWGFVRWESLIGTLLSAAAPLVLVIVSKRLSALVFINEEARG